jgi:hypothetical protein
MDNTALEQRMRDFTVAMTEVLAIEAGAATGRLESEIKKLREEIAGLRAEMEILRAHKAFDGTPMVRKASPSSVILPTTACERIRSSPRIRGS